MLRAQWRGTVRTIVLLVTIATASHTSGAASSTKNDMYEIPGTTRTISGYETTMGEDAMCWISQGALQHQQPASSSATTITSFPTPLLDNFQLEGAVELLRACPTGNALSAEPPIEYQQKQILRTQTWYNFTATIQLNTTSLIETIGGGIADPSFVSKDGRPRIAVYIMGCDVATSGFCSPFQMEMEVRNRSAEATPAVSTLPDAMDTMTKTRQDYLGGSHVHSDYFFIELPTADGPIYNFTMVIPMVVNTAGAYVPILAVEFLFRDYFGMETRYDMANALPSSQRLLQYLDPPLILQVSVMVRQVVYGLITFVSMVILFLLWQTIKYRDHQVMLLTQGSFLALFLVAALTATVATFLLEPRRQLYCSMGIPVVLVSTQLLYAISLGRLWRIHTVISPVLLQTLQEKSHSKKFRWCGFRMTLQKDDDLITTTSKQIRKKVGWEALATRVSMWVVPQIVFQVVRFVVEPYEYGVDWHPDLSIGRCLCRNSDGFSMWATLGYITLCLLMLTLMVQAYRTRSLPSLFNETKDIFDATMITVAIVFLGLGIAAVANGPSTSPDVYFLIWATINLSSTLNSTLRIVAPKLRMIWRGEHIVVSSLLSDHKARVLEDDRLYGLKSTMSWMPEGGQDESSVGTGPGCYNPWSTTIEGVPGSGASSSTASPYKRRRGRRNKPIVIAEDAAPAKRLVLELVEIQQNLSYVNRHVMTGKKVTVENWESLREQTLTLAKTFKTEVQFAWEEKRPFRKRSSRRKKKRSKAATLGFGCTDSSSNGGSTGSERSDCVVSMESMLDDSIASSCETSSLDSGAQQQAMEDGFTSSGHRRMSSLLYDSPSEMDVENIEENIVVR